MPTDPVPRQPPHTWSQGSQEQPRAQVSQPSTESPTQLAPDSILAGMNSSNNQSEARILQQSRRAQAAASAGMQARAEQCNEGRDISELDQSRIRAAEQAASEAYNATYVSQDASTAATSTPEMSAHKDRTINPGIPTDDGANPPSPSRPVTAPVSAPPTSAEPAVPQGAASNSTDAPPQKNTAPRNSAPTSLTNAPHLSYSYAAEPLVRPASQSKLSESPTSPRSKLSFTLKWSLGVTAVITALLAIMLYLKSSKAASTTT